MSLTPIEGVPTTQLFQSFNGKILLGGYPIIRIRRCDFRVGNMPDIYYEIGKREGITFARSFDVRGSFVRAYINGAEWRIAIGLQPRQIGGFDPGTTYGGSVDVSGNPIDAISDLLKANVYDNSFLGKNTYPIKTTARLEINSVDGILSEGSSTPVMLIAEISGIIIDASSLILGSGGDLIVSGPHEWVGEEVKFSVAEMVIV